MRSISINELLQLWNVLKDDISLIGICPLLVQYFPLRRDKRDAMKYDQELRVGTSAIDEKPSLAE